MNPVVEQFRQTYAAHQDETVARWAAEAAARRAAELHPIVQHAAHVNDGGDFISIALSCIILGGVAAFFLTVLLVVLAAIKAVVRKFWPNSRAVRWLKIAMTLCLWVSMINKQNPDRVKFLALINAWRKKGVGDGVVYVDSKTGRITHLKVSKVWWENDTVRASFEGNTGGWISLTHLNATGQVGDPNVCWYFTPARWAVIEPYRSITNINGTRHEECR